MSNSGTITRYNDNVSKAVEITIQGEVPSKKNMYRRGNHGRFYIDSDTRDLLDDLHLQLNLALNRPKSPLPGSLRVTMVLHGGGRRDADNQATTILDLLQKAGYIKNDKNVVQLKVEKVPEKGIPYTDIKIEAL